MTTWTDNAIHNLDQLAKTYQAANTHTSTAVLTAHITSRHQPIANPALPFDPRPMTLAKQIRTFSQEALREAQEALLDGRTASPSTITRLKHLSALIGPLDALEETQGTNHPDRLSTRINNQARTLNRQWANINPNTTTDWTTTNTPCPTCGATLTLNHTTWDIQCTSCDNTWTQQDLRDFLNHHDPVANDDTPTPSTLDNTHQTRKVTPVGSPRPETGGAT